MSGEVKVVAGGTDLLPSMKQKLFTPPYVLDLRGVSELRGIRHVPGRGRRDRRADHAQRHRTLCRSFARIILCCTKR